MLLTLSVERIVTPSTGLWTSSEFMRSENISEWVWRSCSSLICVPLSKHAEDLVDH